MASSSVRGQLDGERLDTFWQFVAERQNIWYRQIVEQQSPPWTDDPVLQGYYFTNIYRELDPGTQYAIQNILEADEPKPDKLFNVMIYRLIGRLETHQYLGFQRLDAFDPSSFERKLKHRRDDLDKPVFTGAYMVSGYSQMGSDDKVENITQLFAKIRDEMEDTFTAIEDADRLQKVFSAIRQLPGFGEFLAYQITVDLLYPLDCYNGESFLPFSADDWAKAGPGAKKGVKLLYDTEQRGGYLDVMQWLQDQQQDAFERLDIDFKPILDRNGERKPISLANIQNCLCEFHKYCKIQDNPRRSRRCFTEDDAEGVTELRELYEEAPNITLPR